VEPTKRLPLFLVSGASCVGKSTACQLLFQREQEYLVLESDLLWEERWNTPENLYAPYRSLWMRLCANIAQGGRPVVLCGCCVPEQLESRPERKLFSSLHYLALVCGEEALRRRVARRQVTDPALVQSTLDFNAWLQKNAGTTDPPMGLLDTTSLTPEETAQRIHQWIRETMEQERSAQ
jgi:adenylate kinase family enzyme